MPLSALGKPKDVKTIVKATPNIYYAFRAKDYASLPGVSAPDLIALGHAAPGTQSAGTIVVTTPKAPKPARFRKKLSGSDLTQNYVSTFGDGVTSASILAAQTAGWEMTSPPRTVSFGPSAKSKNIAVKLSNGVYVVRHVPTVDATSENATLFGWELTLSPTLINKAIRGAKRMRSATVKKALAGGGVKTFPCRLTKIGDAEAAGWKKDEGEFISDGGALADEPGTP